ncbi:MAG: polysaccharide deacetylase family protein [Bacteroidota bacterium]
MLSLRFISISLMFIACSVKSDQSAEAGFTPVVNNEKEVVCFVYHRFGDERYPSTNIKLVDFEAQLSYLKNNRYTVLSFSDAIDYLRSDSPATQVAVLTIDDGFNSFYEHALPLLTKYGFPATLFINTKTVGGSDYMDWSDLKEAQKQGVEIGNHTHSHDYFLDLPESERYTTFEKELTLAQNLIQQNTGHTPVTFAYPYGELDPKMRDIVEKAGFKAAAAQNSGVIYNGTDLWQCPRFPISESYASLDEFTMKARTKALRVTSKTPRSFLLPDGESRPKVELSFESLGLRLDQLQCFVQGSKCELTKVTDDHGTVMLSIRSATSIAGRRRTLYTVTVPDDQGQWHWFSHLWINHEKSN